jgi:hypothetical protein
MSGEGDGPGRGAAGGARSAGRTWPRVAAGAFIIGLAVVLAVLTSGAGGVDDDEDEDEEEAAAEEAAEATDGTTTTAAPTTTTTPTTTVPPWQPVQAAEGAFSLELPGTWAFASLVGDPAAIVQQLYATRPTPPVSGTQVVTNYQCPECHSIAIDPTRENVAGMPTNVTVLIIPGVGGAGLDGAIDRLRTVPDPQGMVAGGDGRLTSPAGEMAWLDFTIPGVEVTGRHYFLVVGADLWRLTYTNPWNDPDRTVPDRIATSLTPAAPAG